MQRRSIPSSTAGTIRLRLPRKALDGVYEHGSFGYRIALPAEWKVEREGTETLLSGPGMQVSVRYTRLSDDADHDAELQRLAEQDRNEWERWTQGWDASQVISFRRESADAWWIRYYGDESPAYCSIDRIRRVLIASYDGKSYGVVIHGQVCGAGHQIRLREVTKVVRSFNPG